MDGNVALLTLKVAEWGKMMLQQPQEWMSAVLPSAYLDKGEIHLIKTVFQKQTNLSLHLMMLAFCNVSVLKMFLIGFEPSSSCSQNELSSKEFQTCQRDTYLLKSGMTIF